MQAAVVALGGKPERNQEVDNTRRSRRELKALEEHHMAEEEEHAEVEATRTDAVAVEVREECASTSKRASATEATGAGSNT